MGLAAREGCRGWRHRHCAAGDITRRRASARAGIRKEEKSLASNHDRGAETIRASISPLYRVSQLRPRFLQRSASNVERHRLQVDSERTRWSAFERSSQARLEALAGHGGA